MRALASSVTARVASAEPSQVLRVRHILLQRRRKCLGHRCCSWFSEDMTEFQTDVHQCPFCKLRCLDRNVLRDHVIGDHPSHADSCVVSERVAMIASSSSPPSSPVGFIMIFLYNGLIRSPGLAATRAGGQGPDSAAAPLRRVGVQRRRPRRPGSRARARRPRRSGAAPSRR